MTDDPGRCAWCGYELGLLKSSCFEKVCDDCGIRQPWERAEEQTIALVGCGSNKIVTSGSVPIESLYTSDYFRQKAEFGREECDDWLILSAKHGLVDPDEHVQTYDTRVTEHDEEQRYAWLDEVGNTLRWLVKDLTPRSELVLLAGRDYLDPIWPILETLPIQIRDPFAETSGIGEQRAWLSDELAETEQMTLGEIAQ